jgi:hypothetical protein
VLHKTLIALAAATVLGCVPAATGALAAGHPGGHAGGGHAIGGHPMAGHPMARYPHGGHVVRYGGGYRTGPIYTGPIYDSCGGYGYGYGGCPGYGGVPLVGGVINGILGGYGPY